MNTRSILTSLALAAAASATLGAQAATAAATPAATRTAASAHKPVARRTASPQRKVALLIDRDAATQARLAADVAHAKVTTQRVGALESQAADIYRSEASLLLAATGTADRARMAVLEHDFRRAVAQAEHAKHGKDRADRLDRLHDRVATARDADDQRWLAQGLRSGRLSLEQAAAVERAQSQIVARQALLEGRGHETVDEALAMQHLQDVQDWAIRTGHVTDSAQA